MNIQAVTRGIMLAGVCLFALHTNAMQNVTQIANSTASWFDSCVDDSLCSGALITAGAITTGGAVLAMGLAGLGGIYVIYNRKGLARAAVRAAAKHNLPSIVSRLSIVKLTKPLDDSGKTVAHYAAEYGALEVMRYLATLSYKDVTFESGDKDGRNPLMLAIERFSSASGAKKRRYLQIIELLSGLRVWCLTRGGLNDAYEESGNNTPLHFAVKNNLPGVVKILVYAQHARLDKKNGDGDYPFDIAIKNNFTKIIRIFGEHSDLRELEIYSKGLVHRAVFNRDQKTLEHILASGFYERDWPNPFGQTALHHAGAKKKYWAFKKLLFKDFDPDVVDQNGVTPLNFLHQNCDVKEYTEIKAIIAYRKNDPKGSEESWRYNCNLGTRAHQCAQGFDKKPDNDIKICFEEV